ncbi:MAG TPA: transglycosylase SLT domain-containing protein [Actinocrinis sp.]|nr:transglycosylase SLT domain-containing protein [Actinocrinis sp.]
MTGPGGGGFEVDSAALAGLAAVWARGGEQVSQVAQSLAALLGRVRLLDVDSPAFPATAQFTAWNTAAAIAQAEQAATALAVALGADAQGLAQCARDYQSADDSVKDHIGTVAPPPIRPAPPPAPPAQPVPPRKPSPPPDQVHVWVHRAFAVLEAHGTPASRLDLAGVLLIIQHESGGDPAAINRWDSNWRAGHPSIGLMQCIDSTFEEYKLPGHGDILNPVDNIIAGVRYALSRYGSIANVPGVRSVRQGGPYVGY